MAVCEPCWAEANSQVMLLGGSVIDRYLKLIAQSPDEHPKPDATDVFALPKTSANTRLE